MSVPRIQVAFNDLTVTIFWEFDSVSPYAVYNLYWSLDPSMSTEGLLKYHIPNVAGDTATVFYKFSRSEIGLSGDSKFYLRLKGVPATLIEDSLNPGPIREIPSIYNNGYDFRTKGATGAQGVTGIGSGGSGGTGAGIQGVTGIQGITGPPGSGTGTDTLGATGLQGVTGISYLDVKANQVPVGDNYYSGIFPWQNTTLTSIALDDINKLLLSIAPAAPGVMSGDLVLSNTIKYPAIIPTGLTSAWYQDGRVAGSTISDYVIDGTYNLATPNPSANFKVGSTFEGDIGTVIHVEDGVDVSSRAASSGTGISGNIEITALDNYNSIWRKANARINYTQISEGYKTHAIRYQTSAVNQLTNTTKVWFDNADPAPSFASGAAVTQNTLSSSRYLSGIRYYYTGDTFNIAANIAGIANKCIRPSNPLSYIMPGIPSTDIAIAGNSFAYNSQYNMSLVGVPISVASVYNINAMATITARKPSGKNAVSTSVTANRLINTYPLTYSTNGTIYMLDENYRWLLSTDFSAIPGNFSNPTGNWNSSSALPNGNILLYNNTWNYPNINFTSGYLPAQGGGTNYSTFSGDQVAVWATNIGVAHSGMNLIFTGIVLTDISAAGLGNLNVELRLPNETGWIDVGRPFGDGNGCRLGSSTGSTLNITFGTYTSTNSNGVIFIRVTLRNASASKASRMIISGT